MKHIALFDDQVTGHHYEFLSYLRNGKEGIRVTFVVPNVMIESLRLNNNADVSENIQCIALPEWEESSQLKKTWKQGKWLAEQAKAGNWTHLFFMNMDPYQHVIGSRILGGSSLKLGGILFSPPHRLRVSGGAVFRERANMFIRRNRKFAQLKFATSNPNLEHVFLLDDFLGADELNGKRKIFYGLSDPIPTVEQEGKKDYFLNRFSIPVNHEVLLAFGSVIPRKNVIEVLNAFKVLSVETIHLVFLGKGKGQYVEDINNRIDSFSPEISSRIHFPNEFVDFSDIPDMFSSADVALMAYKNFFGSSGVLGHAASAYIPVVAANNGLVASLVEEHGLGVCVEPTAEGIAIGIKKALTECIVDVDGANTYLANKNPVLFGDRIYKLVATS